MKKSFIEKELIEIQGKEVFIADPVFRLWFRKEYQ